MLLAPILWVVKVIRVTSWSALALGNSLVGAALDASAAADADVGINHIDVAFADGAGGAHCLAGSTSNAVFSNYVCHSCLVLIKVNELVVNCEFYLTLQR